MEKKRFEEEMSKKSKILGVRFSVEQIEQFYKYMNLLIEWNEKMNLTAITEPKEIILKHFIDSLTILKYIDDNSKLVDVGTGAGFPGVPLSIMNPTLKITLVDSLNKRLIFLQEVVKEFKRQEQQLAENFTYQTVASILYILEKQFGFGKKRLNNVVDAIESLNSLQNNGIFGQTFDNLDLIEHLKAKYDIDVAKRIKVHLEWRDK